MTDDPAQERQELLDKIGKLRSEIGKVIVGQAEVIEQVLMAILSGGHCLMVGVPGLAKTLLVSTISQVLDLSFKRIQFTPDLMPGDITGSEVIQDQPDGSRKFVFVEGPLFCNMVLADEVNRTPPKTQAALLEAMQEHHITIGRITYKLHEPFFVLATQNPIEQEGTYPLPEAQQDRFMFFLNVRYPEMDEEVEVLRRTTGNVEAELEVILGGDTVLRIQRMIRDISSPEHVLEYATRLVRLTRLDRGAEGKETIPDFVTDYVEWGAGPRASQYLILGAKALAFMQGRPHIAEQDVLAIAHPVLRHRVILNFNAEADGLTPDDIVDMAIDHLKKSGK